MKSIVEQKEFKLNFFSLEVKNPLLIFKAIEETSSILHLLWKGKSKFKLCYLQLIVVIYSFSASPVISTRFTNHNIADTPHYYIFWRILEYSMSLCFFPNFLNKHQNITIFVMNRINCYRSVSACFCQSSKSVMIFYDIHNKPFLFSTVNHPPKITHSLQMLKE